MSSRPEVQSLFDLPVSSLEYRDMASSLFGDSPMMPGIKRPTDAEAKPPADVQLSEAEFADRIKRERADAVQQMEQGLRQDYEQKLQAARAGIVTTLSKFEAERNQYYSRVEAEVVQLALSIAAKILHREAQVDPMLVATLVRIVIDKMREGSTVTIRVGRGRAARWKEFFAAQASGARIEIVEDAALTDLDCLLETELGTANFGLDTQLKEIEQGFFDLLALRPSNK